MVIARTDPVPASIADLWLYPMDQTASTWIGLDDCQLESLLQWWQGVLRLRDWKIRVARSRDMNSFARLMQVERLGKTAVIYIRQQRVHEDWDGVPVCVDEEVGLVHEMIHLQTTRIDRQFDFLDDDTPRVKRDKESLEKSMESAIEIIAQALVSVRRGGMIESL